MNRDIPLIAKNLSASKLGMLNIFLRSSEVASLYDFLNDALSYNDIDFTLDSLKKVTKFL